MDMAMLDGAKHKIDRANYHISDVERQFATFAAEKPHRFLIERNPETGAIVLKVESVKELPSNFPLIIGDAIHNLRTALDHATWEIVGIDRGTQNRYLKFPTGNDRISFEASCKGIVTSRQWVKDALIATEAFPGGKGDDLDQLTALDNTDKHTVIIASASATTHPPVTIKERSGEIVVVKGNMFIGDFAEMLIAESSAPDTIVEFDNNVECPASIFFKQTAPFRLVPAIPTLKRYSRTARDVIDCLERSILRHVGETSNAHQLSI